MLVSDLSKVTISIEDVYDCELQLSLQTPLDSSSPEEGVQCINEGNLPTILAGTLVPVQKLDDITNIVNSTTRWFVLGQARPALESFQKGLSTLGVLDAVKAHPDAFQAVICSKPEEITSEIMETLFTVTTSPVGSSKAITESLVLSHWHDYLQDIEEGEDSIALSDILFSATGCKVLPPRKISPVIEFLHETESWGQ